MSELECFVEELIEGSLKPGEIREKIRMGEIVPPEGWDEFLSCYRNFISIIPVLRKERMTVNVPSFEEAKALLLANDFSVKTEEYYYIKSGIVYHCKGEVFVRIDYGYRNHVNIYRVGRVDYTLPTELSEVIKNKYGINVFWRAIMEGIEETITSRHYKDDGSLHDNMEFCKGL